MGTLRKHYTDQFKEEAVKLAENVGIVKAANDLGTDPGNIRRWRRALQNALSCNQTTSTPAAVTEENLKLKKENRYLLQVNEILKKVWESLPKKRLLRHN